MNSKGAFVFRAVTIVICVFHCVAASATVLTHRYPFDANANDVIGTANGTLQGSAIVTNGMVVIRSGSGVGLPANLFTNYDSITFEVWFVEQNLVSSPPDPEYICYFSGSGGSLYYSVFNGGVWTQSGSSQKITIPLPIPGRTNHIVWTQDSNSQTAQLYLNGALAGQLTNFVYTPALLGPTTVNELGNSSSGSTLNYLNGSILEFRVYNGALSPLEVAQSDAAGPERPLADFGPLQNLRVAPPSPRGPGAIVMPTVYTDFIDLTNVNVISQSDLILSSDDTNVIAITPQRKLLTVRFGTANVTAVYLGLSNTVSILVAPALDVALVNRYSFSESTNQYTAYDSVSSANGRLFGSLIGFQTYSAQMTGKGELKLAGNNGYVALPAGIISTHGEITLETWITYQGSSSGASAPWPRIFDFGSSVPFVGGGGTYGLTYMFFTPNAGSFAASPVLGWAISTNSTPEPLRLAWTNTLPLNITSHLAVTYSPIRGIANLYLNGAPIASGTAVIPLSAITDTNNWLGKSQYSFDPYSLGRYDEFRIYDGFLQDTDIAADYAAGPNVVGVDFVLHAIPSNTNLTISWGPSASGWILESSPVLNQGMQWAAVSNMISFQNGRLSVTVPMTDDSRFFRLHNPL